MARDLRLVEEIVRTLETSRERFTVDDVVAEIPPMATTLY